ncbi:hypothetical protein PanWU01x14_106700 [Parasponia andersonii]|uniref:Uncharacterized protein n=1 Tax=Parasponia andersonii TaxID=3476 RepID=A0A2P5D0Q2_PARAD|nr:hypothetical protein PanWU01x14_106700 [Parasponia andersonii]
MLGVTIKRRMYYMRNCVPLLRLASFAGFTFAELCNHYDFSAPGLHTCGLVARDERWNSSGFGLLKSNTGNAAFIEVVDAIGVAAMGSWRS